MFSDAMTVCTGVSIDRIIKITMILDITLVAIVVLNIFFSLHKLLERGGVT